MIEYLEKYIIKFQNETDFFNAINFLDIEAEVDFKVLSFTFFDYDEKEDFIDYLRLLRFNNFEEIS